MCQSLTSLHQHLERAILGTFDHLQNIQFINVNSEIFANS